MFCLLSPDLPVFYNFSPCFSLSFGRGFLITKLIETTFFVTKFFLSVCKLTKTLKTNRKKLSMIIIVINCLSKMTFFCRYVAKKIKTFQGSPCFWPNLPVFLNKKSEISRFLKF